MYALFFAIHCSQLISGVRRTHLPFVRRHNLFVLVAPQVPKQRHTRQLGDWARGNAARCAQSELNDFLSRQDGSPRAARGAVRHGPRTYIRTARAPGRQSSVLTVHQATSRSVAAVQITSVVRCAHAQRKSPPLTAGPRHSPVFRGPMAVSKVNEGTWSYGRTSDAGTRTRSLAIDGRGP